MSHELPASFWVVNKLTTSTQDNINDPLREALRTCLAQGMALERERCAKLVEELSARYPEHSSKPFPCSALSDLAAKIRAGGEA